MSLKPPKKSDLNKAWMKSKPDKIRKIQPEYHLIVTEGTNTEPAYFEAIKNIINEKYYNKIKLDIHGKANNTINLFGKALNIVKESPNIYKHVWIVYDTDDFPAEHVDKVVELCNKNNTDETTYHAIWSNQCIELWFLLHFSYMQSDIHRDEYKEKLTGYLLSIGEGEYTKNRDDMYKILLPYIDTAIAYAKKLDKINELKPPSMSAPGTKIYELIEILKPYLIDLEV